MAPSDDLRSELRRRESNTAKVISLFERHPNRWIHWKRIAAIGGECAWRTRISEARKFFAADGGVLECNHKVTRSAYRYLVQKPLGRPADVPVPDHWPAFDAPIQEVWKLTSESVEKR